MSAHLRIFGGSGLAVAGAAGLYLAAVCAAHGDAPIAAAAAVAGLGCVSAGGYLIGRELR